MLLYRLTHRKFAADVSGEGAKRLGGRWNPPGWPVHYTSTSASLAVLEYLLHVDPEDLPPVVLVTYCLPDALVSEILPAPLPRTWRSVPAPARLAQIGRQWLESQRSLALRVPSVLFPDGPEYNVLVNPQHPASTEMTTLRSAPFTFDPRLFHK
jgi:RES domain-containing protein